MTARTPTVTVLIRLLLVSALVSPVTAETLEPIVVLSSGTLPPSVKGLNAELSPARIPEGGGYGVEVAIDSAMRSSGVEFEPPSPWNWSEHKDFGLALDIANTGDYSVQLFINIVSNNGVAHVRSANIPPDGKTRSYYTVLDGEELKIDSGLRDDPPARDIDGHKLIWLWGSKWINLAKVNKIVVYGDTMLHDRKIIVGNVRLIDLPEIRADFLKGIVDKFGQNSRQDFPLKIGSEEELRSRAATELAKLAKSSPLPDRSKFGGWKDGPQLEGTGYFRTEKVGDKWAIVDPEGYLYWATGIDNARMANTTTMTGIDFKEPTLRRFHPDEVTPEDSKSDFVETTPRDRGTRFIASELRKDMFTWLPTYDDPLADHYHYKRTVHKGPLQHGEAFSFYEANLERRYGQTGRRSYRTKWRDVTVTRMLDWGFTSMGNWADASFFQVDKIPYFANGWVIGDFKTVSSGNDYWSPMPDPFDPEFARRAQMTANAIAADVQGSPWCVGVFIDNEKGWGREGSFESAYGLVMHTLGRDAAECPTKTAFVQWLKQKYDTVTALNAAWETQAESWEAVAKGIQVEARNQAVADDFSGLMYHYAAEYFRIIDESLNAVLPNHMYMGVRMAHWGMTSEVRAACAKYADIISYNFYKEGMREEDWPFLEELDKPSIIGEFHMGTISDSGLYHPGLIVAADQEDRARMFKEYMQSFINNPYFVGAHWFQYIDSPLTGRGYDGENYNVGFVTVCDVPYPEMVQAAKELNASLYPQRFGK